MAGRQAGIIETVFGQAADLEILDHDIGVGDQCADAGDVRGLGEIGDDPALAAVASVEIRGGARAVALIDEGRSPGAGIVAGRALDLDHFGAKVGQHLPCPRPGQDAGEFDDLQAGEGIGRCFSQCDAPAKAGVLERSAPAANAPACARAQSNRV